MAARGKQEAKLLRGASIPVELVGDNRRERGTAYVETFTSRQRQMRALRSLGLWWGLALVSIAIPILHFILVPLFFLIGLVAPALSLKRHSKVLGGRGGCPYCGKPFEIAAQPDSWPLHDICSACNRHVSIEKSQAA